MPQFIPLVDLGGVVYPIRVLLNLNEAAAEVEPMQTSNNSCSGSGIVKIRSFAEVVAAGAVISRPERQWRRKEVERRSLSPVYRVAESSEINSVNSSGADLLVNNATDTLFTNDIEGAGDNIVAGLGSQSINPVFPFDLNEKLDSNICKDSPELRGEPLPALVHNLPGPDAECIAALVGLNEQTGWEHVSETDNTDCSDNLTIEDNTELLYSAGNITMGQERDSSWFDLEAQPLGRIFQIADSEDDRCRSVLERVHLNFGENGKYTKKKRIDHDVELADGIGVNSIPNDD